MCKVITWQANNGSKVNVTPAQQAKMEAAGVWPKNEIGQEYCRVSFGLHHGTPTYTDAEIDAICGQTA